RYSPSTVLCAVDFSEQSRLALKYSAVGAMSYGARLVVIHAHRFDIPPYFTPAQIDTIKQQLDLARAGAVDSLRHYAGSVLGRIANSLQIEYRVVDAHPVDAILDTASTENANLVVLGTHGRGGAKRLWLGSVAENVATHAEVPVFIVRQKQHEFIDTATPEAPVRLKTVVVPTDFGPASRAALGVGASIAERFHARLVPVCVLESRDPAAAVDAETKLKEWLGEDRQSTCVVEPVTRIGSAHDEIVAFINETRADLLVLGSGNTRIAGQPVLGRTTRLLLRKAPVPVLVVPPGL
ncbi:MAG: universal stress protein, partial [Verrucomicrobiae bacterium]|nr:universal stress protein [Verrucomicrobiae bacterium]